MHQRLEHPQCAFSPGGFPYCVYQGCSLLKNPQDHRIRAEEELHVFALYELLYVLLLHRSTTPRRNSRSRWASLSYWYRRSIYGLRTFGANDLQSSDVPRIEAFDTQMLFASRQTTYGPVWKSPALECRVFPVRAGFYNSPPLPLLSLCRILWPDLERWRTSPHLRRLKVGRWVPPSLISLEFSSPVKIGF